MPPSEQMKLKKNNFMVDDNEPEELEAARQFNTALGSHGSKGASNATLTTKASKTGFAANIDGEDEDSKGPINDESSSNVLFHPPAAHEEHSDDSINEDINFAMESTVASNV